MGMTGCALDEPAAGAGPAAGRLTEASSPEQPGDDASAMTPQDTDTEGGALDDAITFIAVPDVSAQDMQCNLFTQDCPAGEKCTVWANDGGNAWNATVCRPVTRNPGGPGQSCWAEGVSGYDSCDYGSFCWDVDPETQEGMCISFCTGSEANALCDDPSEVCSVGKTFAICLPRCDPLGQDCPPGCACYGIDRMFLCAPDGSGDIGAVGDPCEFVNACDVGNACVNAAGVPGCTGSAGCCSSFCELGDADACPVPGQECVSWFEEGAAPAGTEHVGVCFIPQ
jgi:hypothetical protein